MNIIQFMLPWASVNAKTITNIEVRISTDVIIVSINSISNKFTDYYTCIGIQIQNDSFLGNETGNNHKGTNWILEFSQSINDRDPSKIYSPFIWSYFSYCGRF